MNPQTVKVIIALSLLLAVPAIKAECQPSLIGSPCAHGGLAGAGQVEPGITLGAGNPVHLATGNKYQQETDLPPNPGLRGLELVRHYNAMDVRTSALGRGWVLSYDTRLYRVATGWQIMQADGSRVDFPDRRVNAQGIHHTGHGQLRPGENHIDWFHPTGTSMRFEDDGWLTVVQWPNGESVYIVRHADDGPRKGHIKAVQNDHGQRLAFHYGIVDAQARLTGVDTPLGRFDYSYDMPQTEHASSPHRLISVSRPDGMQRRYLHEPELQAGHPYALTGIEIVSPATAESERINTWAYDAHGRAIESIGPGSGASQHRLRFDYLQDPTRQHDGLTVVSDASRGKTRFYTTIRGNRHVLAAVEGKGCFGCAAPGTRAAYDTQGRLTRINGTQIERSESGAIRQLQPAGMGWPGLALHYNDQGKRDRWHSSVTGIESMRYNDQGLPVERRFANGDTATMSYDVQHRPVHVRERHGDEETLTRLHWHGHRLVRIEHPEETETRRYDDDGRVTERSILREAASLGRSVRMSEEFRYDDKHRLTEHQLPEGGSLDYHWGQGAQIKAIYWHDINGRKHTILESVPGAPGYRYGNGLHLDTAADSDHLVRQLQLRHDDELIWMQELGYDSQQRIVAEHHLLDVSTKKPALSSWRYAYDGDSRLAGYRRTAVDEAVDATVWLAWQDDGSAAAIRTDEGTRRPDVQRDVSGLATHIDGYTLAYGANRRLTSVSRDGKRKVRYRHNAFGYRIHREDADGRQTDYFYLNNQLVAESVQPGGKFASYAAHDAGPGLTVTRRYVYAHHVPVAIIDYSALAREGRHYAVHADLQGAPRLVTDHNRQVRWLADYTPLGHAEVLAGDMQLDLRLPGQVADPDTGWHDNLLRTYMPAWGHYLEPDPMGPVPGNQAFGYASQQPRRYADPMGLLLFAFDGTRQTADTGSNVWKMSQYYLDGPVRYHPGPGNDVFINWDTLTATQAREIIDTQWKWLLNDLSRPQAATEITPIDILGFSRGAALARHFGNLIAQHVHQGLFQFNDPFFGAVSACVDLRFMGLFDTVAQFGIAGSLNGNYDLSIDSAWEWVAHAVALHERRWLFPLTSARGDTPGNVIEMPFIGAHSDIGGGVLPAAQGLPGGRGDLSNVALNWMIWQARAASVSLGDISQEHGTVSQPIVHDFRAPTLRTLQDGDRRVDSPDGKRWLGTQDQHTRLGRQSRTQAEGLIRRHHNWRSQAGSEVGLVDMDGYAQWLQEELGWQAVPV